MSAENGPSKDVFFVSWICISGISLSVSNLPIYPSSPACGLRPAIAIRGKGQLKYWRRAVSKTLIVRLNKAVVIVFSTSDSGI